MVVMMLMFVVVMLVLVLVVLREAAAVVVLCSAVQPFIDMLMVIQLWLAWTPSSVTSKEDMTSAHHGRGDVRAHGARARAHARARRAALGGGGHRALQCSATVSDPQQ